VTTPKLGVRRPRQLTPEACEGISDFLLEYDSQASQLEVQIFVEEEYDIYVSQPTISREIARQQLTRKVVERFARSRDLERSLSEFFLLRFDPGSNIFASYWCSSFPCSFEGGCVKSAFPLFIASDQVAKSAIQILICNFSGPISTQGRASGRQPRRPQKCFSISLLT